ncbi:hypothetical protein [Kitasatospora fiedleri]|uniref:hypothetical protein n=1 Tax=Kitasatospora fiedleri TaxID=2991545 RepID=UPI00249B2B80|nr:hypothetical protein [Kitasatospora fiedleri]
METLQQRRYLEWAARELGVPVADRDTAWLWDAEGVIVVAGWEESTDARCDVACAGDAHLTVHHLLDHRVPRDVPRSA